MNIKDIFDKAENGTLTFDQFNALVAENKVKFVDLTEGGYVDKQKYTDELANRDTRINSLNQTISNRETDLASLQAKLEAAGTDATKLNDLTNNFTSLQKKYDNDTKAYEKQLKDQAYKFAVTEFANTQNFTCQAAKRDFISSMLSKNLQVENDTIIGATDFVTAYQKENADAFVVEANPTPSEPKPKFAGPTNPAANPGENPNSFNFNFTGVRAHDK